MHEEARSEVRRNARACLVEDRRGGQFGGDGRRVDDEAGLLVGREDEASGVADRKVADRPVKDRQVTGSRLGLKKIVVGVRSETRVKKLLPCLDKPDRVVDPCVGNDEKRLHFEC
jgi:hypothetical protein